MTFPVTLNHLYAGGVNPLRAKIFLMPLNAAMAEFNINYGEGPAMFLAQAIYESGAFRWLEEIWGPTSTQLAYEGRADLGNSSPGDGSRYRGHGIFQVTGKFNHLRMANRFGINLGDICEWLVTPEGACRSAGYYWQWKKCQPLADAFDFVGVTKAINGGTNGLVDRTALYKSISDAMA